MPSPTAPAPITATRIDPPVPAPWGARLPAPSGWGNRFCCSIADASGTMPASQAEVRHAPPGRGNRRECLLFEPVFRRLRHAATAAALLLGGVPALHAQEVDSVVKKLQATHTLTIGYRETSVPLSYLDKDNKPAGYAVELCQDIGEAAKHDLNLPEIKFAYVPVNIQTRQALIANGTVDIVCDGTVRTWARSKQVAFTPRPLGVRRAAAGAEGVRHQGHRRPEGQGRGDRHRRHQRADRAALDRPGPPGFPRHARQRPSGRPAGGGDPPGRRLPERQRRVLQPDAGLPPSGEPGHRGAGAELPARGTDHPVEPTPVSPGSPGTPCRTCSSPAPRRAW